MEKQQIKSILKKFLINTIKNTYYVFAGYCLLTVLDIAIATEQLMGFILTLMLYFVFSILTTLVITYYD